MIRLSPSRKEIRHFFTVKKPLKIIRHVAQVGEPTEQLLHLIPTTKKDPKLKYLYLILVDFSKTPKTHFSSSSRERNPQLVFRMGVIQFQQTIIS